jgi:CubicO group peptidase (beta-lactamase class C family)
MMFPFLILCLSGFTNCQKAIEDSGDLDTRLAKVYKESDIAGFALTVVKNDAVAFQQAYGNADIAAKRYYTNQTTQTVGSVSKLFIGVALVKAIEQGHFNLETPINTLLPFPVVNPNTSNEAIKIKHLITHTAGILDDEVAYSGSYSFLPGENTQTDIAQTLIKTYGFNPNEQTLSLADFLKAYFTPDGALYKNTNFGKSKPGERYAYSNIGSALAAYIIEVKTGQSFKSYTQKHIFEPLGMNRTAWSLNDLDRNNAAKLYWTKDRPLPYYTFATYPDGGLHTCNEDLSKFLLEMMRGYSGASTFMPAAQFRLLFDQKMMPLPLDMDPKELNYGTFWVWFKNERLGHTGGDPGLIAFLAFYPEKKTGFVFISNSDYEDGDPDGKSQKQLQKILSAAREFEAN